MNSWLLGRARKKGIDPMDPAAYGDAPVLVNTHF